MLLTITLDFQKTDKETFRINKGIFMNNYVVKSTIFFMECQVQKLHRFSFSLTNPKFNDIINYKYKIDKITFSEGGINGEHTEVSRRSL